MKPDKLSVHELFKRERRYTVPLYQRSYVWNRAEQWEPLWEDIERQADACLLADDQVPARSHFLGAIVLNVAKIVGSSVARSEVIDGQQRLTTLQIFIAALRDHASAAASAHAARIARLTVNEDEAADSDASFKVWPTNADRTTFRAIMTAGSTTNLLAALGAADIGALPRIAGAYAFFNERIAEYVGEDEDKEDRIFALLQALRTALQIVVIELEEQDDPQVIFETLNARGQPLLPSDLIRNFIFLRAANDSKLDPDTLYDAYWRPFDDERIAVAEDGEDRFWHVEERQGRLTRPRIDLFIYHYLGMKTERDLNIGQLFREFRDWWQGDHAPGVKAFLSDLRGHGLNFAKLMAPAGNDRVAVFARRLKSQDTSTVYPVLLYLMALEGLSPSARDQVISDIESWMVRRFICQLTNKNYNRFFLQLLGKMKKAEAPTMLPDIVRNELLRSKEVTLNWPDDAEFKRGWLNRQVYVKSRPDRSAMVLRAIEENSRSAKNEAVTIPLTLTVEHLLPQKGLLEDYPYAAVEPSYEEETPDARRRRLIHTVGNLTLLTQELNSTIGRGPFPAKCAAIVADSDLRLNAWLRTNPPLAWSEADILKRGEELFDSATQIWKRPITNA